MTWRKYVQHISVSQLKTHERNPRKWALEKLLKLPTCGSYATAIGKMVHTALEMYYSGQPYESHPITDKCITAAQEGLYWLNSYKHLYTLEQEIWLPATEGYDRPPFYGFIDVYIPEYSGAIPGPMIMDHKTSRGSRYFLSDEDLKTDDQMMVYAYWAMEQSGWKYKGCYLRHNQFAYSLKRDVLRYAQAWVTADEIKEHMRDVEERVKSGILATIEKFDRAGIHSISGSACRNCRNAYGPNSCEFAGICDGVITSEEYKSLHGKLAGAGDVNTADITEAVLNFTPTLTPLAESDIINIEEKDMGCCNEKLSIIQPLSIVMAAARDKYKDVTNTWDRREAMTKAVIAHIEKEDINEVSLPSHFIGGTCDPDYVPIITQLKEMGVRVYVEF